MVGVRLDDLPPLEEGTLHTQYGALHEHGKRYPQLLVRGWTAQGLESLLVTEKEYVDAENADYDVQWLCKPRDGLPAPHREMILDYVPSVLQALFAQAEGHPRCTEMLRLGVCLQNYARLRQEENRSGPRPN